MIASRAAGVAGPGPASVGPARRPRRPGPRCGGRTGPSTGPPHRGRGRPSSGRRRRARRGWPGRSAAGRGRPGRSPRRRSPGPAPAGVTTRSIRHPRPRPPAGGSAAAAARPASRRATTGPARSWVADPLPQALAVAQVLGPDAPDRPLRLGRPGRRAAALRADVQRAEPVEELDEVADGRVAEDLGLAVLAGARDPLGQVRDQPGELLEERLLGQPHRLLEPGRAPAPAPARRAPARAARGSRAARPRGSPRRRRRGRPASRGSRPGCRASPSRSAAARFSSP